LQPQGRANRLRDRRLRFAGEFARDHDRSLSKEIPYGMEFPYPCQSW
jgi:hypothetical protein